MPVVGDVPVIHYLPEYISDQEEKDLLRCIASEPKAKWTQVSGRRLQNHGGVVHAKGLIAAPLPKWLVPLTERLHQDEEQLYAGGAPNHVLINCYQPGEGIMSHEDGPLYIPGVAILSLQNPAVIRFRRKQEHGLIPDEPECSLLLMPRSLLTFSCEAYTDYLHGIDAVHDEIIDSSVCNLHLIPDLHDLVVSVIQPVEDVASPPREELHLGEEQNDLLQDSSSPTADDESGLKSIAPLSIPRSGERVSLTVRRVEKVVKVLIGRR